MKRLLALLLIFTTTEAIAQDVTISGSVFLKSYQLSSQETFEYFQRTEGLTKTLYGPKVSLGIGINEFIVNSIELSGQYSKKTVYELSIPVTTVDHPDGTGQYITAKEQFEDFEIEIVPRHYFDVANSFRIGVGPSVGYGVYRRSIAVSTEAATSFSELTFGLRSTFVYALSNAVAIRADVDYTYFKPSYEPAPGSDPGRAGTTDIATFVSDLGGLSSSIGVQVSL